jgi:hypothetical protein
MDAAHCKGVRNTADGDRRKRSSAAEIARNLGISQRKVEQIRAIAACSD